jgi:hypothetical protein
LLDEAVEKLNVVALAGEADGHAGVLAGLEDDGDTGLALQLFVGSSPNRVGNFGPIFRFPAACT